MPDWRCSEGGCLWSEAEPAGLDSEMPHLGGDKGILARAGIFGRQLITGGDVFVVENLGGAARLLLAGGRGHDP